MSFKLDLKVKRAKTQLTRDKPGASTLRSEGWANSPLDCHLSEGREWRAVWQQRHKGY